MKKFEVLSPAGDLESLKVALKAGADAVYFGLNKFNARMKADNISLDNLESVVDMAHMKGVSVYVTINTLLSSSEVEELIEMVGVCLRCGVDAFIVQDLGVIYALKSVYPDIVLHGSTQLGVHNVRGARVAKAMGLSRVVLSREATFEDIKEIKDSVDIELEVFVQGAMCVCFSGNCYLSSIKHGASGNRGLCKQLCRLPFTLSNSENSINGYVLSPRDNCMVEKLKELCDLGVKSFKIEGRLRRSGYVGIATNIYRDCIDKIENNEQIDIENCKSKLKKVFARGEFIPAYFDGKNIIDTKFNNHMGEFIGKVINVTKFKDIYKITLNINVDLHTGDGLKVVDGNNVISLGVGNVEKIGKNTIIYTKNRVKENSLVYRVLDIEFENNIQERSTLNRIDMKIKFKIGEELKIVAKCNGFEVEAIGKTIEKAQNRSITRENITTQINKLGEEFKMGDITIDYNEGGFIPLSEINSVRRDVVAKLKEKITSSFKKYNMLKPLPQIKTVTAKYDRLAIIDEKADIIKLKDKYSALVLSPTIYSVDVVKKFNDSYVKYFNTQLIINLPIIALKNDLPIIDKIVDYAKEKKLSIMINNIYGLDYLGKGIEVFAGSNMNVTNDYSVTALERLGVTQIVGSIEKWCGAVKGLYKISKGKHVLMTFAHCPNITLNKNLQENKTTSCGYACGSQGNLKLTGEGLQYSIRRYKVYNCYFELVDSYIENRDYVFAIHDLREVM